MRFSHLFILTVLSPLAGAATVKTVCGEAVIGQPSELTCEINGNVNFGINWYKSGTTISIIGCKKTGACISSKSSLYSTTNIVNNVHKLTILNVTKDDLTRTWTCVDGISPTSAGFSQCKLTQRAAIVKTVCGEAVIGQPSELTCEINGNVNFGINWYKSGTTISIIGCKKTGACISSKSSLYSTTNIVNNVHKLTILNVTKDDLTRTWTCVDGITPTFTGFSQCTLPQNVPEYITNVSVKVNLIKNGNDPEYTYECDFDLPGMDVWYIIMWYVNDKYIHKSTAQHVKSPIPILKEEELVEAGFKTIGFEIHCGYALSRQENSKPGRVTLSEKKFIGIEILTPRIYVNPGDKASIIIRPSVPPAACSFKCSLSVDVSMKGDTCESMIRVGDCGTSIYGGEGVKNYTMEVTASSTLNVQDVSYINLRTASSTFFQKSWKNYYIGKVELIIGKPQASINGKTCSAIYLVHMTSFTQQRYEHQYEGIFTLYKNSIWNQEVEMLTAPCLNGIPGAMCNIGVAVRSRGEVFMIKREEGKDEYTFWNIRFTQCDKALQYSLIKVERQNDQEYKINLPSGTVVQVRLIFISNHRVLDVSVIPSSADSLNTEGLCGSIQNKQFINRDGVWSARHSEAFSMSWRVNEDESLFNEQNLKRFLRTDDVYFCVCPSQTEAGTQIREVACQGNATDCIRTFTPYKSQDVCKERALRQRKRRSVSQKISIVRSNVRRKRASPTWRNGWTEEKASNHCRNYFQKSMALRLCEEVPYTNKDSATENCVLDIKLTGETMLSVNAVELVKSRCFHEIGRNITFQKPSSQGNLSLFDELRKVHCPYECSDRGNCSEGACVCDEGFGGVGCSLDLKTPPYIDHVTNDGYCDVSDTSAPFSEISVYGGDFDDSEDITCKIQTLEFSENDGNVRIRTEHLIRPHVKSIGEILCPLRSNRSRRSVNTSPEDEFVRVYGISVSNDGEMYSNHSLVVFFNSQCQTCSVTEKNVQCSFKGKHCISDGKCYVEGERHLIHKCYTCSVHDDKTSWLYYTDCENVEVEENNRIYDIVGGAIGGLLLLVLLSILIFIFVTKKACFRKKPSEVYIKSNRTCSS